MKTWHVTFIDGTYEEVQAQFFKVDGMELRFSNSKGDKIDWHLEMVVTYSMAHVLKFERVA
jgi:hypothetical protein